MFLLSGKYGAIVRGAAKEGSESNQYGYSFSQWFGKKA
jgi:hypothetical protein